MLHHILSVLAYMYFSSLAPWLIPFGAIGLDAALIFALAEPFLDLVVLVLSFTKHVQLIDVKVPTARPPGTIDWFDAHHHITRPTAWSWFGRRTVNCMHPEAFGILSASNNGLALKRILLGFLIVLALVILCSYLVCALSLSVTLVLTADT